VCSLASPSLLAECPDSLLKFLLPYCQACTQPKGPNARAATLKRSLFICSSESENAIVFVRVTYVFQFEMPLRIARRSSVRRDLLWIEVRGWPGSMRLAKIIAQLEIPLVATVVRTTSCPSGNRTTSEDLRAAAFTALLYMFLFARELGTIVNVRDPGGICCNLNTEVTG
jgi:hypothetical protein